MLNPAEPLWSDDGAPRITFELERVFGVDEAPEEAVLAWIQHLAVDDAGNLYVFDGQDHRLVAFGPGGTVLWGVGAKGDGPGEFEDVRGVVWDGTDKLFISTQSGSRIDTWTTSGQYVDSQLLSDLGLGNSFFIGFHPPGELLLLPLSSPEATAHVLTDAPAWNAERSFTMAAAPEVEMTGGRVSSESHVAGDSIAFGSVFDYEFRVFNLDGTPRMIVTRPAEGFVPAVSDHELGGVASMGSTDPPFLLGDGNWLVTAFWPTNIKNPVTAMRQSRAARRPVADNGEPRQNRWTIDLFDGQGRWLTGLQWDHPERRDIGLPRVVGPDGALYTVEFDPFPHVRRYSIGVRPPGEPAKR